MLGFEARNVEEKDFDYIFCNDKEDFVKHICNVTIKKVQKRMKKGCSGK